MKKNLAPYSTSGHNIAASLVRNVVYPLWARRDHPAYAKYMHEFAKNQYLDPQELRRLQMRRLRQQLIAAYRYVPFYRFRFMQAGITPLDIQTHEDLKFIPVLTKRDIQDHRDFLVAGNIGEDQRVANRTGGSTGSPLQFWVDKERFDSRRATTDRHNAWAGLRPGDWHALLWGSRFDLGDNPDPNPRWRQKFLYRNIPLHTATVGEEAMFEYVKVLRKYQPRRMVAYAQSAALFAEFCRKNRIDDISFESIVVSAEMLLPGKREIVEQVFRGKVFNRYGCREVSLIASECEHHTGLHVSADTLLVEVEESPELPAGMGRVIVTDLLNRSMPLIRYEIGDLASLGGAAPCPCGRTLPLIGNIEGRTSDFLQLPSGRMVAGPSLALLAADMRDVRQIQFIQSNPHHVVMKIVGGHEYSALTEQELRRRMQPYLEPNSTLSIVTVDSIPCEPSGKYRFVKKTDEEVPVLVAN